MQTHFQILGITPVATTTEIHEAYRRKSMDLHPDVRPGNEEDFLKVRDAYEALKTENERAKYLQYLKLVAKECVVCNGQGVIWKQKSFTSRTSLLCNACDGAGYE